MRFLKIDGIVIRRLGSRRNENEPRSEPIFTDPFASATSFDTSCLFIPLFNTFPHRKSITFFCAEVLLIFALKYGPSRYRVCPHSQGLSLIDFRTVISHCAAYTQHMPHEFYCSETKIRIRCGKSHGRIASRRHRGKRKQMKGYAYKNSGALSEPHIKRNPRRMTPPWPPCSRPSQRGRRRRRGRRQSDRTGREFL